MAGYKAHTALGMFTGFIWCAFIIFFSIISLWFIPLVFFLTVIGSFLPDLDSDSGFAIKVLLLVLSAFGGTVVLWNTFFVENNTFLISIIYTIISVLLIYFGMGGLFKKLTHHRGIFHSLPAVLISMLISLSIMNNFKIEFDLKIVLSIGIGLGYLCHLILDEMNSMVNLEGIPFIPKGSIGTALKIYSSNMYVNIFTYVLLFFLLYLHWDNYRIFFIYHFN